MQKRCFKLSLLLLLLSTYRIAHAATFSPLFELSQNSGNGGRGHISGLVFPYFGEDMSNPANDLLDHFGGTDDGGFGNDIDANAGARWAFRFTAASTTVQFGTPTANIPGLDRTGADGNVIHLNSVTGTVQIAPDGQWELVSITEMAVPGSAPASVSITQKVIKRGNDPWFTTIYYITNNDPSETLAAPRFFQGADWNLSGNFAGDTGVYDGVEDAVYSFVSDISQKPAGASAVASGFKSPFASAAHTTTNFQQVWREIRDDALSGVTITAGDGAAALAWDLPDILPGQTLAIPVIWGLGNTANGTMVQDLFDALDLGLAKIVDAGVFQIITPTTGTCVDEGTGPVTVSGTVSLFGVQDLPNLPVHVSITAALGGWIQDVSFTTVTLEVPSSETSGFTYIFDTASLAPDTYTLRFYTNTDTDLGLTDSTPANNWQEINLCINPAPTATATTTASSSPSPTSTPSPTQTASHSPTPSFTATPTPTMSPSHSVTPSISATHTISPTVSATPSHTASTTETPAVTSTLTPAPSFFQQERLVIIHGIYPNPFEHEAKIYFTLRYSSDVTFTVYNVAGEVIWVDLFHANAGNNIVAWKGINTHGARAASGIYLVSVAAKGNDGSEDAFFERVAIVR